VGDKHTCDDGVLFDHIFIHWPTDSTFGWEFKPRSQQCVFF